MWQKREKLLFVDTVEKGRLVRSNEKFIFFSKSTIQRGADSTIPPQGGLRKQPTIVVQ